MKKFLATIYDVNILEDKLHFKVHSYARKMIQLGNMKIFVMLSGPENFGAVC